MATRILSCLIVLTFLLSSTDPALAVQPAQQLPVSPAAAVPTQTAVSQALRGNPVMFIENVGQFAAGARLLPGLGWECGDDVVGGGRGLAHGHRTFG